jgi:pectate lyase
MIGIPRLPDVVRTSSYRFTAFVLISLVVLSAVPAKGRASQSMLPSFPGAEGYGAVTPGGRGGRVIRVTNLNPVGPGSLQEAVSATGPRIVVFEVSGVIQGPVEIKHGQITIMGQTAPGAGITIRGPLTTRPGPELEDIIVRFLRVRPGPHTGFNQDAVSFNNVARCILDHVSLSWGSDENMGIYNTRDITVQWCALEESDPVGYPDGHPHNVGLLSGPGGTRISIHHNLFTHHRRRNPAVANGPADIRNNVFYNFRDGLSHEGHPPNNLGFNIIGNFYKRGPNDPYIFPFCFVKGISYYLRDNYIDSVGLIQDPWAEAGKLHGLERYSDRGVKAEREYPVAQVVTHDPREAYKLVLAGAGCFPRDRVSLRTVVETANGTGSWGRFEPAGGLMEGLQTLSPPVDMDGDGMPDEWERSKGLDPENGTDCNKVLKSGYTAIEEYCNMLADKLPGVNNR